MMKKYNAEKIPLLPTLLTTGNLVCGFMAFIFAVNDAFRLIDVNGNQGTHLVPYLNSCYLILLAMVFDMFDGIVARLTKTDGRFGVEYDSLADVVSFGVAPAVLMYLAVLRYLGKFGWVPAAIFAFAGALRLARFNVTAQEGKGDSKYFSGLPVPAAASVLVSYVVFSQWFEVYYATGPRLFYDTVMGWYAENITFFQHVAIPSIMIILAVLMISTVKFPSLKYYISKEKIRFVALAAAIAALLILILTFELTVFVLCTGYVLWGLLWAAVRFLKKKKPNMKQRGE